MQFGYKDSPLKGPADYTDHFFRNIIISYATLVVFALFMKAVPVIITSADKVDL